MTGSGNYSLFTWNDATQSWNPVTSTNDDLSTIGITENTLHIEDACALMVRGDWSAPLSSNTAEGNTAATLRTRGTLHLTNFTYSFDATYTPPVPDDQDFEFVLIGNPYQSQVNMIEVFGNAGNSGISPNYI